MGASFEGLMHPRVLKYPLLVLFLLDIPHIWTTWTYCRVDILSLICILHKHYIVKRKIERKLLTLTTAITKQNLSESIAEPSSYSSTTTSGSMYSLSIEVDSEDFLRNMALSIPFTGFFCIGTGAGGFSGGNISTTMQVVSSLSPFACKASWR